MLNVAVSALLTGTSAARTIDFDTKIGNLSEWGSIYQSAFSADKNLVYLTSSVGRPPIKASDLIAVDADSLEVVQSIEPPTQEPTKGGKVNVSQPYAVYGISLDDKNDLIWVTNTRQGTAAYYKEDGLEIGNQYSADPNGHSRAVFVHPEDQLAYVSDTAGVIFVYDAEKKDKYQKAINLTEEANTNITSAMGLAFDESSNTLWTCSMQQPLAASIDLSSNEVKTYDLGDVESASDVAWDSKRSVLYVANQKTNDTVVLDPKSNKVIKTISNTPGALSVVYEPTYDLVYIAARTGDFVAVVDASDYSVIDQFDVPTPNEISLGADGAIYVTTGHDAAAGFYKFTPKKNGSSSSNSTSSSSVAAPSSAPTGSTEAPIVNGANVLKYSIGAGIAGAAAMLI